MRCLRLPNWNATLVGVAPEDSPFRVVTRGPRFDRPRVQGVLRRRPGNPLLAFAACAWPPAVLSTTDDREGHVRPEPQLPRNRGGIHVRAGSAFEEHDRPGGRRLRRATRYPRCRRLGPGACGRRPRVLRAERRGVLEQAADACVLWKSRGPARRTAGVVDRKRQPAFVHLEVEGMPA